MDHLSLLSTDIHLPFEEIITQCCLNYINDHSLDEIEREIDDKKVMAYYSVCMQQKGKR
jgi:hypothetical protein